LPNLSHYLAEFLLIGCGHKLVLHDSIYSILKT
jgi:hypothetical protein